MELDQEFLEYVVKGLVDNPDDVNITRTVDEMGVLLLLDVHKDDMGKIIGRSGNTAKAIRTLLRVVGMKNDARVNLKINEPEGGNGGNGGGYAAPAAAATQASDDVADEAVVEEAPVMDGEGSATMSDVDDVINDLK